MKLIWSIGMALTLFFQPPVTSAQSSPDGVKAYIEHDFNKSFPLLLKEAEAGNIDSAFYLGLSYNEGSGTNINNIEATRWLKFAANAGHLIAPFEYGTLLHLGDGVGRDRDAAIIWFNRGMERIDDIRELAWSGDGIAQVTLSVLYGGGFNQNMEDGGERLFWSRKAYEQGFPQGIFHYAIDLILDDEASFEKGYRILLNHAKEGFVWSMYYAYIFCPDKKDDFTKSCKEETKNFLKMAADKGYTSAKIDLVRNEIKAAGKDKEKVTSLINKLEAIVLLKDSGGEANFIIGDLYLTNEAVADHQKSLEKMLKAYQEGYENAALYLAKMYERGYGTEVDNSKSFEFYLEAAENKKSSAEREVGIAYETGRGVEKNTAKAKEWYLKALESGDEKAQKSLMKLRWTWPTENRFSYIFFIPGDAIIFFSQKIFETWNITHEAYKSTFSAIASIILWLFSFVGLAVSQD